jgi:hypothetical protein
MKKYIAIICALTMSCAVFASCGKKDSDKNSKDSKVKSVTTDAETSEKVEESTVVTAENARTKAFYDSLNDKKFTLTMETTGDGLEDSNTITSVEMNGDNYHLSVVQQEIKDSSEAEDSSKAEDSSEEDLRNDLYLIDGVMYVFDFKQKVYYKDENPNEMYLNVEPGMYTMGIESNYVFVSSEETDDGMICEKYYAPDIFTNEIPTNDDDGNATVFKYYYKEDSVYPEKIEYTTFGMTQTSVITEFSREVSEITLPDLKGWKDDADVSVDDAAAADADFSDEAVAE